MNFWETITHGEYVMFALCVLLITVVVIWGIRSSYLSSLSKKDRALMHRVRDYIVEGDVENAVELCNASNFPGGRVIGAGLSRLGRHMTEVSEVMKLALSTENNGLEKGKRWIYAIAIISPLIGAGGTLAGICDGLLNLAEAGVSTDMSMLSAEVAPAIVTTIVGLGVGVLSILIYFCLDGKIEKTKGELASLALEFEELLNEPT